ncbi:MAG: 23S rRNA (guanosine(2251)-2'-O)-methyltransferase RlmB [Desulfomonile tiedjei]|uniref:23S rRNA (Guanosine(2251)-2'-O)-methyltransferase RlmB n=1 Tax=Desulfomonile tiedjei TaxID=2358 RepID=A0A9D6V881_9BACT|nr:23S rRNA (guanosine(2251)-2'-O)-methyltransferase RlmB [Desulfomonile tiedjei]
MKKKKPPIQTVLYGVHPILETMRVGKRRIQEVFVARESDVQGLLRRLEAAGIPITKVDGNQLASIAGSPHNQGLAARVEPFLYADIDDMLSRCGNSEMLILVLDEIQDPANLGSILRSCECLGAGGVVLTKDRAVPVTPAVEKAAAGASAHVPVARVVNLVRAIEMLKDSSYWVFAADASGTADVFSVDLSGKAALVLGSEGKGLRRLVRERCDQSVYIPMVGKIDSLSVSQSAAVILAESLRQRIKKRTGSSC